MLLVTLDKARPGMCLAMPIPNAQSPERALLKVGFELASRTITRLRNMGISAVWVHYPGLDEITRQIDPEVVGAHHHLAARVLSGFRAGQRASSPKLPYEQYVSTMTQILDKMLANQNTARFLGSVYGEYPSLLDHCAAVSHLAMIIGMRLKDYMATQRSSTLSRQSATNFINLGLGAMLQDIGMLKLDRAVRERFEKTGDTSDPAWREHPALGYEMVQGRVPPTAAVVVKHHHQHYDGSGFPVVGRGDEAGMDQRGTNIHVFARIALVADTFMRLRYPRRGAQVPAVQAIGEMLQPPYIGWFDIMVLDTFLAVTPPYPPGQMVRLSDGRWAVPIDHSPVDPCRPVVQIMCDPEHIGEVDEDEVRDGETVDLRKRTDLSVASAEGQDVTAMNFPPPMVQQRVSIRRRAS